MWLIYWVLLGRFVGLVGCGTNRNGVGLAEDILHAVGYGDGRHNRVWVGAIHDICMVHEIFAQLSNLVP